MSLLENRVAVVTGSAIGIGRAIAVAMAEEGADVALLDIDAVNNAATAVLVRERGQRALPLDCDVSDKHQVRRAFAETLNVLGRVDVLVNNAAVYIDCALTHGDWDTQARNFERSLAIGALGTYYCGLAAVPAMKQAGGGNIVNVITEHVHPGHYQTTSPATGYDCAKFSQWRLTEDWALELKPLGIRVNAVCPGATDTPMLRAVSVPIAEKGMRPEDVALGVLNIIRQGPEGPVGRAYLMGPSQSAMSPGGTTGRRDAEAILHARD
jgi:NAD(P)-dependent dehydrogenase (short-subunit alcohol dehydrogenase family)